MSNQTATQQIQEQSEVAQLKAMLAAQADFIRELKAEKEAAEKKAQEKAAKRTITVGISENGAFVLNGLRGRPTPFWMGEIEYLVNNVEFFRELVRRGATLDGKVLSIRDPLQCGLKVQQGTVFAND